VSLTGGSVGVPSKAFCLARLRGEGRLKGLKYISWADSTGYAIAAKSYVKALIDAGQPLTWTPMMPGKNGYEAQTGISGLCPKLSSVCNRPLDYDTVLIHTVPEYYSEWINREKRNGCRIFGYTVWELERLPDHWPEILNRLDGVIVPCRWNLEVFRESGVTVPIHLTPHLSQFEDMPATTDADNLALKKRFCDAVDWQDRFIFYTIGYWSHRKAPYLALEAYWKAFNDNDRVLMIVKTSTKDMTRWHRRLRHCFRLRHPSPGIAVTELAAKFSRPAPAVLIADESLTDAEMLALHEIGGCFVSLARTEGWGLGAFEAARLGKPVVTTGYGGQLDFLDPKLTNLVDYTMVPVYEPTWSANYRPTDQWAAPSTDQAARHLREILEHPSSAVKRAKAQSERIEKLFSKGEIVKYLLKALQ
jgi:glycosyltransferase involved in cell wall biosynthesis